MCRSNIDTLSLVKDKAEQFTGLPGRVGRFQIIKALKAVGRDCGFSKSYIDYLELLVSYTRESDWRDEDTYPIVWMSTQVIARELNLTPRRINQIEKELVALQAIAFNDYGNYRRRGGRNEDGSIRYAYGVDLRPLALLWEELALKVEMKAQTERLWKETRYAISGLRRQIRDIVRSGHTAIADKVDEVLSEKAMTVRIRLRASLDDLKSILETLQKWHEKLIKSFGDNLEEKAVAESPLQGKISHECEENFIHHIIPTNIQGVVSELGDNSQNKVRPPVSECDPPIKGWGRESLAHDLKRQKENSLARRGKGSPPPLSLIVQSSSPRLRELLARDRKFDLDNPSMDQVVSACCHLAPMLGVSVSLWRETTGHLNNFGASLALIVIDSRHYAGQIKSPGGMLRGMLEKDREGLLNLNPSLYAMVDRAVDRYALEEA